MTRTYRTTKIQWTEHTWNPARGCTPVSEGCAHCYAKRMAGRFGDPHFNPTMIMDRVTKPLTWKKPRLVFVGSMTDLFHDDFPDAFIMEIYATMMKCPQHIFQVLTKRPARMRSFVNALVARLGFIPKNIWHGVTAENQARANERIIELLQTKSVLRFVSAEPLLGPIDFSELPRPELFHTQPRGWESWLFEKLHWVIVGGETGQGARECKEAWMKQIYYQCHNYGVPFFWKHHGSNNKFPYKLDSAWINRREWPQGIEVLKKDDL
jgi:protein gp37